MAVEKTAEAKVHWNKITPGRLIIVFAVIVLLISPMFPKGWPVVILAAGVIVAILYVLGSFVLAFLDERPFQFGIRSILAFTAVVALTCGLIKAGVVQAELQKKLIGPYVGGKRGLPKPLAPDFLCEWFGEEFFRDMSHESELEYSKETEASDADLKLLRDYPNLRTLLLRSPKITDAGLEYVKDLKNLTTLMIENTEITDAGLERLAGIDNLGTLIIYNTHATGAGLKSLKLDRLRSLYFQRTTISDEGWEAIKGLDQLQDLWIEATGATDARLEAIGNMKDLRKLGLGCNPITDAGIAQLKGLTKLDMLDLGGTKITDASLEQIGTLDGLIYLDLSNTKVTDAGLRHLEGLKNLQWIGLRETNTVGTGVQRLHAALPKVKID
jgi:hypothetical protein